MQTTPNLGLKKPESNEYANVTDINDNSDLIDTAVAERVESSGGDISETLIETLEPIDTKYPIPSVGEKVKTFFGKIITFMKNTRPLESDMSIYVATTGSDLTGDGTSASPLRTINRALELLPSDLGGFSANINIAAGTYIEDLVLVGLGNTGTLSFILSGNVTIGSITTKCSNVFFIGSDTTTRSLTTRYVMITDSSSFNAYSNVYVTTTGYYADGGSKYSILVIRQSSVYLSGNTTITGNTGTGIAISNTSKAYFYAVYGSGLALALRVDTASRLTIYSNSLSATQPTSTETGGQIINENGTQISGIISSGLSCTWGTITGGYIRHGNYNGTAMVTINMQIQVNSALSNGQNYLIGGVPKPRSVSVVVNHNLLFICTSLIDANSTNIRFIPTANVSAGSAVVFTATYPTNS